ncbi:MAG: helix-turn-helix domain-containing protein [Mesorhizobium sp.]|nr:helix-turn-helix domain-containing protein [Mesorhizobium sp.]MCO5162706.1 helix-turn-helix domain-containing protein [Mesorhizobium sp.]
MERPQGIRLDASARPSGFAFQREINDLLGTRFELRPIGSNRLDGQILSRRFLPGMRFADLRFTAHSTRLMPGRPRTGYHHTFLVSWQLEGKSFVSQSGRSCSARPGEIFILDTSKPFEIETADMRTRSIYIDAIYLRQGFPEFEHFTATTFDSGSGAGAVCANMISHLFSEPAVVAPTMVGRLADGLSNLLAISLLESETPELSQRWLSPDTERVRQVKQHIRTRLADPTLDCAAICAASGISLRHLHQLFTKEGTTIMRWVWAERLQRIAKDLENPGLAHRTISSIAFDWGFSAAAHFSRAFKTAYKVTPQVYRQRALARPSIN